MSANLVADVRRWVQDVGDASPMLESYYKFPTPLVTEAIQWAIEQACLRARLLFDESDVDGLTRFDLVQGQQDVTLHESTLLVTETRLWDEDPENAGQYIARQWKNAKRSIGYLNHLQFNWENVESVPWEWGQYDGRTLKLSRRSDKAYRLRLKMYRNPLKRFTVLALPWSGSTAITAGAYRTSVGATPEPATGDQFVALNDGTTGASEPAWDTSIEGFSTTTDGSVTWEYVGPYAPFPELQRIEWSYLKFGAAQWLYGMQDVEVQSDARARMNARRFAERYGPPISAATLAMWQRESFEEQARFTEMYDGGGYHHFVGVV